MICLITREGNCFFPLLGLFESGKDDQINCPKPNDVLGDLVFCLWARPKLETCM